MLMLSAYVMVFYLVGHHWLTTLTLSQEAVELDIKLYNQLKERWNIVRQQGERK